MAIIKEDRKSIESLFNRMGSALAGELPEGWTHVCLGYFVDKSSRENMQVFYTRNEGRDWNDFMDEVFETDEVMLGVFECKEFCRELYEMCTRKGDRWAVFTLIIESTGYFRSDFSYEAFEKFTPVQKMLWMGEYLG